MNYKAEYDRWLERVEEEYLLINYDTLIIK